VAGGSQQGAEVSDCLRLRVCSPSDPEASKSDRWSARDWRFH
jgi:hypothetical protein